MGVVDLYDFGWCVSISDPSDEGRSSLHIQVLGKLCTILLRQLFYELINSIFIMGPDVVFFYDLGFFTRRNLFNCGEP